MDEAAPVERGDCLGESRAEPAYLGLVQRALLDDVFGERGAVNVLAGDPWHGGVRVRVDDRRGPEAARPHRELGLAPEPVAETGRGRQILPYELHGNPPSRHGFSDEHPAHPARAQTSYQLVRSGGPWVRSFQRLHQAPYRLPQIFRGLTLGVSPADDHGGVRRAGERARAAEPVGLVAVCLSGGTTATRLRDHCDSTATRLRDHCHSWWRRVFYGCGSGVVCRRVALMAPSRDSASASGLPGSAW